MCPLRLNFSVSIYVTTEPAQQGRDVALARWRIRWRVQREAQHSASRREAAKKQGRQREVGFQISERSRQSTPKDQFNFVAYGFIFSLREQALYAWHRSMHRMRYFRSHCRRCLSLCCVRMIGKNKATGEVCSLCLWATGSGRR